ncbi:MAG: ATP-dependent helicase RecQ [Thermoplasmata archaeon]|jgi:ATP-dependent DNA helicase RecQ|nr:ATP-dependent helicase RecQ [Thermoplasmata archaeon]
MDPKPRPAVLIDLEPLTEQLRRIADSLDRRIPLPAATVPADPGHPAPDPALDRLQQRAFDALRDWRRDRARMEGVPPYFIASDRSLREVARARPATLETLRGLRGFGPVKTAKFGTEILEVVAVA